jgi:TonB family protein
MSHWKTPRALLFVGLVPLLGCQSAPQIVNANGGPLERAEHVYRDYERGNCGRVAVQADPERIRSWETTEARHSMVLVRGFCQEKAGNVQGARETYRQLITEAPLSFSSDDARERLRVLRLTERDPHYKAWVEAARFRYAERDENRIPVDRVPAAFPPLAQQAEIEGYAIVEFGITPRGDTDSPIIVDSKPPLIFDGTALRAVRKWRFTRDLDSTESKRQVIRIVFQPQVNESTLDEEEGSDQPPSAADTTSIQ